MKKRVIIIILDGVGIGELPDAEKYGDSGANTIVNISKSVNGLNLPNLEKAGLGNIIEIQGVANNPDSTASFGKMNEKSLDKDSTSGHWEIAGLEVKTKFPSYPQGFPIEIIDKFIELTGVPGILCNQAYSGTEALNDFGEEHLLTRKPIVYTSADSVFQIATHKDIYPIEKLYELCEIARYKLFSGNPNIARVIARPFTGNNKNDFCRTAFRKDYSIDPPRKTILDILKNAGLEVAGVGKIEDLFNFRGLTKSYHSKTNEEGIDTTIKFLNEVENGLIFVNLVDFDSLWGHRNLPEKFAEALEYFDSRLPEILFALQDDDILFITADHGCDPTTKSTDHSREYVPLLVFGKQFKAVDLEIRSSFSDIAATIADYFQIEFPENGESFLRKIGKKEFSR
ncbi:MAG: phosphopentomutase [Candidatus Cloacimonetes bacterium]|nr:phosphopentomutase [Candidatus Cloacimonadota bacterium]